MPNDKLPPKSRATKRSRKKRHYIISTLLKLGLISACSMAFYGIYLDGRIRNKMDGQIWQLPAEVYARIESIKIADNLSLEKTKQVLLDNGYRQVSQIATPGDFKIEENTLVLLRRAFSFPKTPESQRVLRLTFKEDQLTYIEDLIQRKLINEFRLDPKLIAMLHSGSDEERQALRLQEYPRLLIEALLLTEDKRFYHHDGISPMSIARAFITNYQAGRTVQGGSTLTQQLVKNLFLTNEKSLVRKINEALMSVILDFRYEKNRILETYLNEIYLGQNGSYQIHGFALASQFYFGRPIKEISLDQIALLVGMVKGPSLYNPWRNPKGAIERRNVVLKLLLENQVINQELYKMLSDRPLNIREKGSIYREQPAFMQALALDLKNELGEVKSAQLSGKKIFTTLDRKQQRSAEQAIITGLEDLESRNKKVNDLQSAIVVAEYKTGKVRAIVGDRLTQFAGFNRAIQSKRQIGSLVKPSIYAIALSQPDSFRLNTPIQNQPISIKVGSNYWTPRNYDRSFSGSVMLMDALVRSLNIPTVNIGMKVGLKNVIAKQKEMGWNNAEIPPYPSTLLGAYSISPYDVTRSYQVIANEGIKMPLTTIEAIISQNGEMFYQRNTDKANEQKILPPEAAIQTMYAMQQVVERGTARSLQQDFAKLKLAGKTGTTNNARDTWFVGIDGEHVTTVWLGKDNNSDTNLTGASGALYVYKQYLQRVSPVTYNLPKRNSIQWVGINSYGSWECDRGRQIPVWRNQGQNYCTHSGTISTEKPSIWDALSLKEKKDMDSKAEVSEDHQLSPMEEVAPME